MSRHKPEQIDEWRARRNDSLVRKRLAISLFVLALLGLTAAYYLAS